MPQDADLWETVISLTFLPLSSLILLFQLFHSACLLVSSLCTSLTTSVYLLGKKGKDTRRACPQLQTVATAFPTKTGHKKAIVRCNNTQLRCAGEHPETEPQHASGFFESQAGAFFIPLLVLAPGAFSPFIVFKYYVLFLCPVHLDFKPSRALEMLKDNFYQLQLHRKKIQIFGYPLMKTHTSPQAGSYQLAVGFNTDQTTFPSPLFSVRIPVIPVNPC